MRRGRHMGWGWVVSFLILLAQSPSWGQSPESTYHAGVKAQEARRGAEAVTLFQTACDSGHLQACSRWAFLLYNGDVFGVRTDLPQARRVYQRVCDAGDMPGCTMLGIVTVQGQGGARGDAVAARAIFKKACDGGHMAGCANLANMLWTADGGPQDRNGAAVYARKACSGNDRFACDLLKRWQLPPQ